MKHIYCISTNFPLFQCEHWLKAGCDEEIQPLQLGKCPLREEDPSTLSLFLNLLMNKVHILNLLMNRCICTQLHSSSVNILEC